MAEISGKKIWVLGNAANNADANISWHQEKPNLTNCDILIIDTNTRPTELSYNDQELLNYVRIMLMARKSVIIILPNELEKKHNFLRCSFPVTPLLIEMKSCEFGSIEQLLPDSKIPEEITEYSKYVKHCGFIINGIDYSTFWQFLDPNNGWTVERYPFSANIVSMGQAFYYKLVNKSSQTIGLSSTYVLFNDHKDVIFQTGTITFLPPPTEISSNEAIEPLQLHQPRPLRVIVEAF